MTQKKPEQKDERELRLAEALRQNLHLRKAQMRERGPAPPKDEPE